MQRGSFAEERSYQDSVCSAIAGRFMHERGKYGKCRDSSRFALTAIANLVHWWGVGIKIYSGSFGVVNFDSYCMLWKLIYPPRYWILFTKDHSGGHHQKAWFHIGSQFRFGTVTIKISRAMKLNSQFIYIAQGSIYALIPGAVSFSRL